jgi:hypothetical protein
VERKLDPQDIRLLRFISVLGDIGRQAVDAPHRLDVLEVEGYVSSVRCDPPGVSAPPAWVYRLTTKGNAAAAGTR